MRTTSWAGRAYLGDPLGGTDTAAYVTPCRETRLAGLPPAFILVGDVDLFLDENIVYAQRLLAAGVATELHVYRAGYQAFDLFGPDSAVS